MALRAHVLAGARFGAYSTGELACADALWPLIPDQSLTIVDRNFWSARTRLGLQRGGVEHHWLTRARSTTAYTRVKRLAAGDELVD